MIFDTGLLIITIGFAIIGFAVSWKLKKVFQAFSEIPLTSGMTGREVAEKMLKDNGIFDVNITCVPGSLTDHYNPSNKTVNLSEEVYHRNSVSAAAVAAHECGHAVQHATAYGPLNMRSLLVPVVTIGNKMMNFVYIAMIFLAFSYQMLNTALIVIIICQAAITLFTLVTLPVEFDASNRALIWLNQHKITDANGQEKAKTALKWAASTYLIAAIGAITTLLYYVMRFNNND
jgi:Zn-dependent membrane protease YugP